MQHSKMGKLIKAATLSLLMLVSRKARVFSVG
jgi:hypothetical protein